MKNLAFLIDTCNAILDVDDDISPLSEELAQAEVSRESREQRVSMENDASQEVEDDLDIEVISEADRFLKLVSNPNCLTI